jgi:hypothetical protein
MAVAASLIAAVGLLVWLTKTKKLNKQPQIQLNITSLNKGL